MTVHEKQVHPLHDELVAQVEMQDGPMATSAGTMLPCVASAFPPEARDGVLPPPESRYARA